MGNILTIIKSSIIGFVILFMLAMFVRIKEVQHERDVAETKVMTLSSDIEQQNMAVEQMKDETQKQITKLLQAQKDAQSQIDNYSKKAKVIMKENVSTDCIKAMQWGANKGSIIYKCWAVGCKN